MRSSTRILLGFLISGATAFGTNAPPVVSITEPASGFSAIGPLTITLESSASSSDSTIASVSYYKGATRLATETSAPYTYNWPKVAAGSYSITAIAKDALGVSSIASSPVTVTVIQDQAPLVTLSVPANPSMLIGPASVPLAATASSPDGESITSVSFFNGTKKLGTSTAAPYSYTWKNVVAGTYSLTAVATDSLGIPSLPSALLVTVAVDQPPGITLTAAPASGYGTIGPTSIQLVAAVSQTDENIASVAFFENGSKVATAKLPPWTFVCKNLAANTYSFYAVATDVLGTPSQSAPVSFTITPDPPANVSITTPSSGSSITGPAKIVLTATASSPDESILSVEFEYQGPTKIATVTKLSEQGAYQYTWSNVAVGTYTVTAIATDSLGVKTSSSPTTITVTRDQNPTVSIITPIPGANYPSPASIGLSANASSPDVSIASVTYYQGTTKLATEKTAPYLYTWKTSTAGSYSLTAQAIDSVGGATISAPVSVNVTSTTTSTAKITKPTTGSVVAAPGTVAITATATASAGVANVGFYAGGALLGSSTSTTSTFQYTWSNAPAGLYYLTVVETDNAGGSVTSAPVSFRVDAPPVVLITMPANGSPFIGPNGSINLAASATSAAGTITSVEYFENGIPIGTSTTAPYQISWSGIPLGNYTLTAEALDSFKISAFSPAISVSVVTEMPPVISLTTPTSGLTFGSASNVSLSYNATASTSISKIEIYRNGSLVGTLTNATSGSTWTFTEPNPLPVGQYKYFASAYDSTGASTESAMATVTVDPSLPYLNDFETADGFNLGPLSGQVGWTVSQGTANVSTTAYSGSQGVQLAAGTPMAIAQEAYASSPSETIIFCDFYALPTAETSVTSSTVFIAEGAEFGFQQSNGQGVLQVFRGNGGGGGTWVATNFSIPINSSNQAQNWVRLTARLDFTHLTWDMYANGNMVAYDIPFLSNSSTYFSSFQAEGDVSVDSFFDDMYIGADNPLFVDVNNDGIDDAWESLYGLSLSTNDRYLNLSGDGIPMIQDYISGTSPFINNKVTPPPVQSGLILDLRADAGVVTDSNGNVINWLDQSTQGNLAVQGYTPESPQLVPGQINGYPALNFNVQDVLLLPYNMMQNAQAGEIIGVVKIDVVPNNYGTLWEFGTGQGTAYYNLNHFDDFGTSDTSSVIVETQAQISQYYIYDTSIGGGTSVYRYNGVPLWTRTGLPQGFQSNPFLGAGMVGDIAEVLVYNRVLTDAERFSIGQYLTGKYAFPLVVTPSAPSNLAAVAISSDTVDLSWTVQNPESMHTVTTIERQTGSGALVQVAQVNDALGYADTGLSAGTLYTYQITVQSYLGTSGLSNSASATTPSNVPDPPLTGLSMWLRSTVGTQGTGPVAVWADQSGQGNNANQTIAANQPSLVLNQVNGLPTIQFNGSDELILPANMLQNAQSGQIIALVQVGSSPNQYNMLWEFGTYLGSSYYNSYHLDDFGTSDSTSVTASAAEIGQYFTYDTSISADGTSIFRADGTAVWTRTGLPVAFQPNPDIGGFSADFVGNIAEILVYDRVLSSQEQSTVYSYLAAKYGLPSIVTNLNSPAITSSSQGSGEVGQTFSYQITATNSPTSYGATGLPDGLSLNSTTGLISGFPTASSTATVNLTATNSAGTGYQTLTLAINLAAPVITSAINASGQVGLAFSYQIDALGASSYTALGLPPGLSADSVAGLISGTPTTAGTYTVALTAANISGSATATLTIVINPAITLTSPATASGQVGQSFTYQVTTASTVTNFSASGLPPGLTIDPNAGAISGAPTTAGVYAATLNLTTAEGTSVATLTITVAPNFPVVNGMLMWFRADAGVVADSNGNVSQWTDQSGLGNNAVLASGATSPLLVLSQANGPPVVRFNGPNALSLPVNVMQNAQEGEIIAIVKIASDPNDLNTLWNFGSGNGSAYFNTNHFDDFGNSDQGFAEVETQAQISQYYVYDTSIDVNGSAIYRYNGTPLWTRTSLGTGFNSSPAIGGAGAGNFYGDIAEIFVYSRALSSQEQSQIYSYLASKYSMPGIVGIVASPAITSGYFVTGTDSQPFSFQVTANGNPTSFSASGLPTGLSMNSVGLITGTPTSDGPFTVTVSATNAAGSGSSPLYITINAVAPVVTSASSATALAGQSFSYQITASFNPTSYSASGLPLGLSIDSNGFISGTPAASGVSTVILTAANSAGSETFDLTISVTAAQGSSQSLPYTTGFEVTDGFTVGALGGQNGWTVSAGSAAVTTLLSHTGTQSVQLAAGTPVTNAELILNSTPGETIEFCDFYAQPVAEASISNSTIFTVEGARFGFQQANGVGVLQIYRGNGTGGGDWEPTSFTVALGAGNQVSTWIRLTARLDFSGQSWGLYANGVLVATGIQLINSSSTYLSTFEIQGNASTATNIDDLYVGPNEPLFTDVNNDGIPDAWETANGLSLSANNANSHDFSSTLTDLEVYELGLNPAKGSIIDDSAVQLNVYAPHP